MIKKKKNEKKEQGEIIANRKIKLLNGIIWHIEHSQLPECHTYLLCQVDFPQGHIKSIKQKSPLSVSHSGRGGRRKNIRI